MKDDKNLKRKIGLTGAKNIKTILVVKQHTRLTDNKTFKLCVLPDGTIYFNYLCGSTSLLVAEINKEDQRASPIDTAMNTIERLVKSTHDPVLEIIENIAWGLKEPADYAKKQWNETGEISVLKVSHFAGFSPLEFVLDQHCHRKVFEFSEDAEDWITDKYNEPYQCVPGEVEIPKYYVVMI